jgi:hypothetical protein
MLLIQVQTGYGLTIAEVRDWYQKAEQKEKACRHLIDLLQGYTEKNHPLFAGYKACATMMMAKHVINPLSKLSWFIKGKDQLEAALEQEHNNIELRFLRFANQTNIPGFLGYRSDIDKDKNFLLKSLPQINDAVLKKQIIVFMHQSKYVSKSEKNLLHE